MRTNAKLTAQVRDYWNRQVCGTRYGLSPDRATYFSEVRRSRYELEPYIEAFADFASGRDKDVLEIGVGAGSDLVSWVRSGARVTGVDIAEAAVSAASEHLALEGLPGHRWSVRVADAQALPFPDGSFDIVYTWGVMMHIPDTAGAFRETFRVLKPGGILKAMVYREPSWVGWLLWARWCLLTLRPWRSVRWAASRYLESPGTKVLRDRDWLAMLAACGFTDIRHRRQLSFGDLLVSGFKASEKYRSRVYSVARWLYPRWLVRLTGNRFGLYLLIEARRPAEPTTRQSPSPAG